MTCIYLQKDENIYQYFDKNYYVIHAKNNKPNIKPNGVSSIVK